MNGGRIADMGWVKLINNFQVFKGAQTDMEPIFSLMKK